MTAQTEAQTAHETGEDDADRRASELVHSLWITPSQIVMDRIAEAIRAAVEAERQRNLLVLDELDFRPEHHDEQVQTCMEGAAEDALIAGMAAIRARGAGS